MMRQKNISNLVSVRQGSGNDDGVGDFVDQPVSSMREGPGDDGVALLVVRVASLQLPLGRCGAVANAPG